MVNMDKIVQQKNNILKNNYTRIAILIITGVFMGYTLQPVPTWLNNIFNTSQVFKFIVLYLAGLVAVYPVSEENMKWVFFGTVLALTLFQVMRQFDGPL
jgi:hypothetical protein